MTFLAKLISSVFFVGYCPIASGTAGTAAGLAMVYALKDFNYIYIGAIFFMIAIGIWASGIVEKAVNEKDPGIVVIDEVVGIFIAMLGIPISWATVLCGFFLFRAFDMFKIYPINRFEALPGGWGIMLDDVMAGLYTNIALAIAVRWAGII